MVHTASHDTDVCVVGGGMAGLIAAMSAARHGANVILMHDRPVLGGNASSECRVHICGADRNAHHPDLRETGILEELRLANLHVNPQRSYSVWDTVLYDAARRQDGLQLMLNCSACDAEMDGPWIVSVTGWQTTTQTRHTVRAKVFIDCSGDAILAPLTGAASRSGREARDEYGESLAPEHADAGSMGMTLAFAAADQGRPMPFTPPAWAHVFERCEDIPDRAEHPTWWQLGYWWNELGGVDDSVHDTEAVRDRLLATMMGLWDHIKNRCCDETRERASTWALEWVQYLPAKRDSRRYVGKYVLVQDDLKTGGDFDDTVAYGGWSIDEHPPVGIAGCAKMGVAPACHDEPHMPYAIPYRSLVARNVENLLFAGRCASCSHVALSSTRVMATAAVMGQAAGTAAAIATRRGIAPAGVSDCVSDLQQALIADDAYLPGVKQQFSAVNAEAKLTASAGDPSALHDGFSRPIDGEPHAWDCRIGDSVEVRFAAPATVHRLNVVADSDLNRRLQLSRWGAYGDTVPTTMPEALLKDADVEVLAGGQWQPAGEVRGNIDRFVRIPIARRAEGLRLTLRETWGNDATRLFALWVE